MRKKSHTYSFYQNHVGILGGQKLSGRELNSASLRITGIKVHISDINRKHVHELDSCHGLN